MCGIAGFLGFAPSTNSFDWELVLSEMRDTLYHRGPDSQGVWLDTNAGVGLTHRRLSVIDLSLAGHQPMVSASGRYVIVFNGEIYNHGGLRHELNSLGYRDWRGQSDTETLLACVEIWGTQETLNRITGMFAFALWDTDANRLILARDRVGEKPLYYGWQGNSFLFTSELKALKKHPSFKNELDRESIALLMQYGAVPAPHSIYQNIHKLMPGTWLSVSLSERDVKVQRYWDAGNVIVDGLSKPFHGSIDQAIEKVESLLCASVSKQMLADVPVGAMLSGGIDSSVVVAIAQSISSKPIKTFTIGFNESAFNEATFAKEVASHLGTDHTELYVSPQDALEIVPELPNIYCEPFADSSQIPTYLVSRLAREQVTVALSGDGGDELFGGYNRYLMGRRIWDTIWILPPSVRRTLKSLITGTSPHTWNQLASLLSFVLPKSFNNANIGDKLHKASGTLVARSDAELYRLLISQWLPETEIVNGLSSTKDCPFDQFDRYSMPEMDFVHWMMAEDTLGYLPNDILTKVDRAAMAVSLETRIPMLDRELVEFAWSLPLKYKIRNSKSKWPLRKLLEKHIPENLIARPKMGFGVPIDSWLRGPLKDWAEALISDSRLSSEGYLNSGLVRTKWQEHQSGERNWQGQLWNVLMFQAWLEAN